MLNRWLARLTLALVLGLGASHMAQAGVVTFSDVSFGPSGSNPPCDTNTAAHQGMSFGVGVACYYGPGGNNADFPIPINSNVMAATVWDTEGLEMTVAANSMLSDPNVSMPMFDPLDPAHQFDLISLDLTTGPDPDSNGLTSGFNTITGYFGDGSTQSRLLFIGNSFATYDIHWSGLTNVIFRWTDAHGTQLIDGYNDNGDFIETHPTYLAFDNIVYSTAGTVVPEPSSWALLVLGFGGLGAVLRSARRRALPAD